ncbi:MAG: glycosyltransferase family 4 protein [Alphaproteobacteria bacterium]
MKILFAIKAMDDIKGGAERVIADVTAGLIDRGHEVLLLTFDKPNSKSFYPLHEKLRLLHLGVGAAKERSGLFETVKRIIALRKEVTKENPDCVVGFMHSMFIPLSIALLGTGIPAIASEHIVPQYYKNRKLEFFALVFCGLLLRRITVLSDSVKNLYPRILRSRMVSIANPVCFFARDDRRRDSKIILNIGRLTAQKDQETLIDAFAFLAKEFPDWILRIIGEGELEEKLKHQIGTLGLSARVILAGTTSDIEKEYRAAAFLAVSSRYESFGLVTAEAMACGLPVVGFADCPGTNELIIDGENGFLVRGEQRARAFSEKMATLMRSVDIRLTMGERGVRAVEKFAPEKIIDKWENIIIDVISKK